MLYMTLPGNWTMGLLGLFEVLVVIRGLVSFCIFYQHAWNARMTFSSRISNASSLMVMLDWYGSLLARKV